MGAVIACAPVGLLVASLVTVLRRGDERHVTGLIVVGSALAIGALDFYLSAIRPRLRATDRHVSGFPIVGTLLVVVATLVGFGSIPCAALGLVALAIDTGGAPWFVIATWRDASLWTIKRGTARTETLRVAVSEPFEHVVAGAALRRPRFTRCWFASGANRPSSPGARNQVHVETRIIDYDVCSPG